MLLLLEDLSPNPDHLTLGILNERSLRNKGPLLADIVATNDLDFLCLTETHIRPFDSDSFLWSITPPPLFYHTGLVPQVLVVVLLFIRSSYRPHKIESPFYQSFENMVMSIGLHGHLLLFALQDHVPVTFLKNSCHLLVSCHLLTLHSVQFMRYNEVSDVFLMHKIFSPYSLPIGIAMASDNLLIAL